MAIDSLDALGWLRNHLEQDSPDLVREMVKAFAENLMAAEADAICGAGYGERSPERVNSRNGYRHRDFDTRAGTIDLAVPKLREGSYFPGWLLEPRRRAERALTQVVCQCYVEGVSTRRVDDVVKAMGIEGISKSQVSAMAKELDALVEAFRSRPLEAGPYTYVWLDALSQKVREGGRVVNVAVVIATGVNNEGRRESLGFEVITTEDGAGWTAFLRSLVARGLSGVSLVVSDDHKGLKAAIAAVLPGATWQRCRTHFARNLLTRVPKASQGMVATLVRTIFEQPDHDSVWAQHARGLAGVLHFPRRALVQHQEQQPSGTVEQRAPPANRRGRDLPQPGCRRPPGRRRAVRAERRMGGRQALHGLREPDQSEASSHRVRNNGRARLGGRRSRITLTAP